MDIIVLTGVLLGMVMGCASGPTPFQTAAVTPPSSQTATLVSSARFLAPDPTHVLSNSERRNCRFGRTDKIQLVPATVEWTTDELRLFSTWHVPLNEGALPTDLTPIAEQFQQLASHAQTLSSGGCHPWRSGPEDASTVPVLLFVVDGQLPGSAFAQLSMLAADAGLIHQAVWVSSTNAQPISVASSPQSTAHVLRPQPEDRVADVVAAMDEQHRQGQPCVQLHPQTGTAVDAQGQSAATEALVLRGNISVLPLFWPYAGAARLVTGALCPAPALSDTVLPTELLEE